MANENRRNNALQSLCRDYLNKLSDVARKHGLLPQLNALVVANANGKCVATETEVELLGRAVDDERVSRTDVPKILGKSYRRANEDGDFERVKRLKYVGIFSKVSAILLGEELKVLNNLE